MILATRIDANPLSLRHPCGPAEPGRDANAANLKLRCPRQPEAMFDPEYAAFRAELLALARDGHQLLGRIDEGGAEIDPRAVREFLQRIDRFEEDAIRHRVESVQLWLQRVRCLIRDRTS